ncbi:MULTISPECIES: sensor histidine kinase [unclassified Streptomyces]|uniref:sensor histidine kinase n=1 Tax=unclassified Streptomyces TaxID=2593676 RepID=UPI00190901A7|nr:histidine kinase [Streptomyces sp. HSG2]
MVALPRPHRFDVFLAVAGLLCGAVLWGVGLVMRPSGQPIVLLEGRWPPLLALSLTAGCAVFRRSAPRAAVTIATAALVVDTTTEGSLVTVLLYTDVVYAAVLYGPPATARALPRYTGLITAVAAVVPYAVWRVPEALLVGVYVGLVTFAPASTGLLVRGHRERAEAAVSRAEQTALLAEMDRVQAVTAERARMAREWHDLVANRLSAVALHSTAALSLRDEATSREALSVIRENSVAGLEEMRRLIALSRDPEGDDGPGPAPTLAGLDSLVASARAHGTEVRLVAGQGAGLSTPVELAAYRIVQESLTNALKHAGPGPVTVVLARAGNVLRVEVTSPYDGDGPRPPRLPGSGAGLVGMRERVGLLGGDLEVGPRPVAGEDGRAVWSVRARLPVVESATRGVVA